MRTNTERPVTIRLGTNRLVGYDMAALEAGINAALDAGARTAPKPIAGWDGQAAERIAEAPCQAR